jgi:peptide-methionine (S)-S-oxide reductase
MRNLLAGLIGVGVLAFALARPAATLSVAVPPPALDAELAASARPLRTAVLSGGCFWGVQAVYQHVRGVKKAVSGYAGGAAATAHYEIVGRGGSGHAESVQVFYDPSQITYGQLLRVFFGVAHDPTTLNRQGPDEGTQYRSAIFVEDAEQEKIARAYIAQLDRAGIFRNPIVTEVATLPGFYEAEEYHQDYATLHPDDPYIMINDAPKVASLKKLFPALYVGR